MACASLVAVAPRRAAAAELDPAALVWLAPAECPSREDVLRKFSSVLADSDAREVGAFGDLRIRGTIGRSGERWSLTLNVDDGVRHAERRLDAERCDELAHAAALALALLLEQARSAPTAEVAAAEVAGNGAPPALDRPESLAEPAPAPAQDSAPIPPDTPVQAAPVVSAGVRAVLDSSTLPQPSVGLGGALGGRLGAWSAGVYGQWLPARRVEVAASVRSVEFEHWAFGARGCRALAGQIWVLEACAGAEFGRVFARGLDLDRARDAATPWWSAGVGLGARWNRAGGAVQALAELVLPLARERYVVNADDRVHTTPVVTGRLALGVDLDL